MDLEKLNPAVYQMWKMRKELGGDVYYQPSSTDDIAEIEHMIGHRLPPDYVDFLLEYSTVGAVPSIGAYYFPIVQSTKMAITYDYSLVPWAKNTIGAIRQFQQPHPEYKGVRGRLPPEVLPLTSDNNATLLIDLREASFGNVMYIRNVRNQAFGVGKYGWNFIWNVAPTFTDFLRELATEDEMKARYPGRKVL